MMLSVICPTYNEEKYIKGCIESILAQDFSQQHIEVFFVDGMSKDRTREIIGEYVNRYGFIHLLDNPNKTAPWAMNIGIEAAHGDVIIRLDAHVSYATNYFSELTRQLIELDADNVGAVCITDVRTKNSRSLAIRAILSNRFGVGNSLFRIGVDDVKEVDTVPFGCWKKEAFEKYGLFDVRLSRNQDFEFNHRIKAGGGKIYLVPGTQSTYYARDTFRGLARQAFLNGKWTVLTVWFRRTMNTIAIRHVIPFVFLMSLLLPLLAALFYLPLVLIAASSLAAYLTLIGLVSLKVCKEQHLNWCMLMWSFITLHLSNGYGLACGLFCLPLMKR